MRLAERLSRALSDHQPRILDAGDVRPAAVSMVIGDGDASGGESLLLIERASREGDPWSGHIGLPGGRVDAGDDSRRAAAVRETREEVGVDLDRADYLGRLSDLGGAGRPVVVSAFAFRVPELQPLVPEPGEVADAFWVPVDELLAPGRLTDHEFVWRGQHLTAPAIDVLGPGRPLLWGLTYRFIADLLRLVGHDLPHVPYAPR